MFFFSLSLSATSSSSSSSHWKSRTKFEVDPMKLSTYIFVLFVHHLFLCVALKCQLSNFQIALRTLRTFTWNNSQQYAILCRYIRTYDLMYNSRVFYTFVAVISHLTTKTKQQQQPCTHIHWVYGVSFLLFLAWSGAPWLPTISLHS